MGLVNKFKDVVEDKIVDGISKNVTGNYKHFRACKICGKQIDIKRGYEQSKAFSCPECEYILCEACAVKYMRTEVLDFAGTFKKGRRYHYIECPNCGKNMWKSDIEFFRKGDA